MPKRSKEDTVVTINTIMDAVVDQLLTIGYDRMSYTTLSKQTGISRTGISHHFPKKSDFTDALDDRIIEMFIKELSHQPDVQSFKTSWLRSLELPEFQSTLKLIVHHIVAVEKAQKFALTALTRLYELVTEKFGKESHKELEWLLGYSIVKLTH